MDRFVVITGCSCGGKSSLRSELQQRGFATVEEPGRRIVMEENSRDGTALPWSDVHAFLRRTIAMCAADLAFADQKESWVFFDRGIIDAAAGLERILGIPVSETVLEFSRFHRRVFFAPPWPEIYQQDNERRHSLDDAIAEYRHLLAVYSALGYDVITLPKASTSERADFVLSKLLPSMKTPLRK